MIKEQRGCDTMIARSSSLEIAGMSYWVVEINNASTKRIEVFDRVLQGIEQLQVQPIYATYKDLKGFYELSQHRDSGIIKDALNRINNLRNSHTGTGETEWEGGQYITTYTVTTEEGVSELRKENGVYDKEVTALNNGIKMYTINLSECMLTSKRKPMYLNLYEEVHMSSSIKNYLTEIEDIDNTKYVSAAKLRIMYSLSWIDSKDYIIFETDEEVREYMKELRETKPKYISIDYETNTLAFHKGNPDAKIAGLGITEKVGKSRYLPLNHTKFKNISWDVFVELIACIKELQSAGSKVIAFGAEFESLVHKHQGIDLRIDMCVMHALKLLAPDKNAWRFGLKPSTRRIFSIQQLELSQIFHNKKDIDFIILPKSIVYLYALADPDYTLAIMEWCDERLNSAEKGILRLEGGVMHITAGMLYYGVRVDMKVYHKEWERVKTILAVLEATLKTITKSDINWSSGDQLVKLLYVKLNRPIKNMTKSGKPSTDAAALKALTNLKRKNPTNHINKDIVVKGTTVIKAAELNMLLYPEALLLLAYKKYEKLETGYFQPYYERIVGDRLYFDFKQYGTETARASSGIHTLPSAFKEAFIADTDNHVIVDTDYSCMEVRILFGMSHQLDLVEQLKDIDADIHRIVCNKLWGVPIHLIDSKTRTLAKRTVFGVPYLISPPKMAEQIHGLNPTKQQVDECRKAIDDYYNSYLKVHDLKVETVNTIESKKAVSTFFGRQRRFAALERELPNKEKSSIIRQGNNAPIQGTASDILKIALTKLGKLFEEHGLDKEVNGYPLCRVAITIHDEIVLMVSKDVPLVVVYDLLQQAMEIEVEGFPPMYAVPAVVNNMLQAKADAYAIPGRLRNRMIEDYRENGEASRYYEKWSDPVESQMKISNEFRDLIVKEYLEDLIVKHGISDELYKHVNHRTITYETIARYPPTKEYIAKNGYPSPQDSIKIAVDRYLEERESSGEVRDEPTSQEENIVTESEELDEILVTPIELYDSDGNLIEVQYEEEFVEEEMYIPDAAATHLDKFIDRYGYLAIVDSAMLEYGDLDTILKISNKYHKNDGEISLTFFKGKMIDSKRKFDIPGYELFVEEVESKIKARS